MKLGVLVATMPEPLMRLLALLSAHVTVVDGSGFDCDWYLVDSPAAAPRGAPVLHWLRDGPLAGASITIVSPASSWARCADESGSAVALRTPAVVVAPERLAPGHARPILAFTRSRLRQARGLAPAVAGADGGGWWWGSARVSGDVADSACGAAAAVVATGADPVLRALAWAAAVVTDEQTAAELDLADDLHCLVREGHASRLVAAAALVHDQARAARLGWRGRARVEARHLPDSVARRVVAAIAPIPADAWRLAAARLDLLNTPSDAVVRDRIYRVVAPDLSQDR